MNPRVLLIEARRHLEAAVRSRPEHVRYLELLGEVCLVCGDSLVAIPHLERALAGGRSTRSTWLLAWAYVHAGRLADVERLVRELIEEGRGCARALYVRGLARFKRRAFDHAIEDLREAMPDEADVPFFRRELARALIGAGSTSGSAPPLGSRSGAAPNRAQMLRDAVTLLKSGDIDDPDSAEERGYLMGCALLELGESTRALSVLSETEYPTHAEVSFRRGVAAAREGDAPTAQACFTEARASAELASHADACIAALADAKNLDAVPIPAPPIAPVGLGLLHALPLVTLVLRGDDWPASLWAARKRPRPCPEAAPEGSVTVFTDPEERIEALRSSLRANRLDFDALADCVAIFEFEPLEPAQKNRLLQALAVALRVDLKRPRLAVERIVPLLLRVREVAPGLAFPRLYLARYFFRVRDFDRAFTEISAIPGPLARSPAALNVLGRTLESLGKLDEAERSYRESLALQGEQPTIQFSLARLLLARYRKSFAAGPS